MPGGQSIAPIERRAIWRQRLISPSPIASRELAAAQPDAAFLIHQGRKISYGEADARADEFARIAWIHGVGKGDAVAIMMRIALNSCSQWLGVLKLGACAALISPERKAPPLRMPVRAVVARFCLCRCRVSGQLRFGR